MAEETAGIGNAAALVTRARPQGLGILQGLKMAESSALAKAKMEAAAEAKKQAKMDKMSKFMTMTDKMKEPYTQKKANELSFAAYQKAQQAAETGDMQGLAQAEYDFKTAMPFIHQEDENVSALNPRNNREGIDTKQIYLNYNLGGLPKALEAIPDWLRGTKYSPIQQIDDEEWTVNIPKAIDLDNTYSSAIRRFLGDNITLTPEGKITTSTRKLTAKELLSATAQLIDDPKYKPYIVNNSSFQDYYKNNYSKGNPENLKNTENLDRAITQFTREKLDNYNDTKITKKEKGKGGIFMFNNGLGASTNKYDFFRQDLPMEGFKGLIENEKINFGDAEVDGSATQRTKLFLDQSEKSGNVTKVELPQDAPFSLTIEDKIRRNPSLRSVKPLDLVKTQSGQIYLIYGDGNDQNYTRHITPATTKILNSLKSFYYKDDATDVIEAIGSLGIDLSKGFEKNSPTVTGKRPKQTGKKDKKYDPNDPI
jgi:hypothetical protein